MRTRRSLCSAIRARITSDVDGLILVPELSYAVVGRHTELFKVKTKHTVDFLVAEDGIQLGVYNQSSRSHMNVARARTRASAGAILECSRGVDELWDVVCMRTDKRTANDKLTYERTLVNMKEAISYDELQAFFEV